MKSELVLIVEDEPEIADIIDTYLGRVSYRTVKAADGETALLHFNTLKPDLVLLDLNIPKPDGVDVLRKIRKTSDTPVIVITAMDEDVEKIATLRLGADDYIVKPFNPLEVVERAKAVLRRSGPSEPQAGQSVVVGPLIIDASAHAVLVEVKGQPAPLPLTNTEYLLLAHMAKAPQKAFTRSELIDACLPDSEALERTMDSHVSNARRKLEQAGIRGYLEAVRGVGYRLEPLQC